MLRLLTPRSSVLIDRLRSPFGVDRTVRVGDITVRYVHSDAESPYALLEWTAPPGSQSPPVHIHHLTDEGFYVLRGRFAFMVEGQTTEAPAGTHVLVKRGRAHTL